MPKKTKARATKEIKHVVNRVSPEMAKEILDEVVDRVDAEIAATPENVMPGMVVNGMKVPWTHDDLCRVHGIGEFTPEATMPITVNGVRYQLFANVPMAVPKNVIQVYYQCRKDAQSAGRSLPDMGYATTVELGAGPLN